MEDAGPRSDNVEVNLLGRLEIRTESGFLCVSSSRLEGIFSILAINAQRVVPVEELIDELWAEDPPAKARNAVQAGVARLRRMTQAGLLQAPRELIMTAPRGYLLDVDPGAVDVNRFVKRVRQGTSTVWDRPEDAVDLFRSALRLWRGSAVFKGGSGVRRQAAAAMLDEWYLVAREDLIVAQLLLGQHREALSDIRELRSRFAERERFVELLMIALYLSGRQTESLDEFHRMRRWLRDTFGVEPGPELYRLQQLVLERQTGLVELLGRSRDRTGGGQIRERSRVSR
jgi:SARP family transcriptional regulator, regulator of embCAB operon